VQVKFADAQLLLINWQWQAREDIVINEIVREEHEKEILVLKPRNAEIDRKNMVRKTLKKKALPRLLPRKVGEVRADVLKSQRENLLSDRCCPIEIRKPIISSFLREIKKTFMNDRTRWRNQYARWRTAMKVFERRGDVDSNVYSQDRYAKYKDTRKRLRTMSVNYASIEEMLKDQDEERRYTANHSRRMTTAKPKFLANKTAERELADTLPREPVEPVFHAILDDFSLDLLVETGLGAVKDMNQRWQPKFSSREFDERGNEGENLMKVRGAEERGVEVAQLVAEHLLKLNSDGYCF